MELFGQVLSIYLGPGVDVEEDEEAEPGPERLYAADLSHSGWVPDPVFPTLDWGDEDEQRTGRVDLGHGRQRQPDTPAYHRPEGFGFGGER